MLENREEVMRHEVIKRRMSLDGFDRQVLVGARRAGKSYILYGKIQELIAAGYSWDEIVYVNFEDEVWDGLKGYVTNTTLPPSVVVAQYQGLWVVEKAFRVSKGTLETRPIFHFTEKRIEAHVCLCFVAYKIIRNSNASSTSSVWE